MPLKGQNGGTVHTHNDPAWFVYSGEHAFSRRWTLYPEVQVRRADLGRAWQELQVRQGIGYALTSAVKVAAGYTYVRHYPSGPDPAPFATPEHRIHEQITISQKAGEWKLGHRFRVEERFLGELPDPPQPRVDRWEYETRLRYRFEARRPLSGDWYVRFTEESLVRIGPGRALDQQRTYAGAGRPLWRYLSLEVGYMYRLNVPATGPFYQHDHILHVTLSSSAPLRRGIK